MSGQLSNAIWKAVVENPIRSGLILFIVSALLLSVFVFKPIVASVSSSKSVLSKVKDRGVLRCGIHGTLLNFSARTDEKSPYEGIDADYCRVIAAALFGKPEDSNLQFVPVDLHTRFSAITDREVDVVFRNTTWTIGRELEFGVSFGPIIYYDRPEIMVADSSHIRTESELEGKTICVQSKTSTLKNVERWIKSTGNNAKTKTKYENYDIDGERLIGLLNQTNWGCDAIAADRSQLIARTKTTTQKLRLIKIDFDGKEPLAPLYVAGDFEWARLVDYSVFATIYAAELGINQEALEKEGLEDNVLVSEDIKKIAKKLGLNENFIFSIVKFVGNYDDIYQRYFKEDPEFKRNHNQIYEQVPGLLYSPAFDYPKSRKN